MTLMSSTLAPQAFLLPQYLLLRLKRSDRPLGILLTSLERVVVG